MKCTCDIEGKVMSDGNITLERWMKTFCSDKFDTSSHLT